MQTWLQTGSAVVSELLEVEGDSFITNKTIEVIDSSPISTCIFIIIIKTPGVNTDVDMMSACSKTCQSVQFAMPTVRPIAGEGVLSPWHARI